MLSLSRKSNPGPPALQASTLWIEPFERPYLVAIRDLTCAATKAPFRPCFGTAFPVDLYSSPNLFLWSPRFYASNWRSGCFCIPTQSCQKQYLRQQLIYFHGYPWKTHHNGKKFVKKRKKEQNLSFFDRQISVSPIAIGLSLINTKDTKMS